MAHSQADFCPNIRQLFITHPPVCLSAKQGYLYLLHRMAKKNTLSAKNSLIRLNQFMPNLLKGIFTLRKNNQQEIPLNPCKERVFNGYISDHTVSGQETYLCIAQGQNQKDIINNSCLYFIFQMVVRPLVLKLPKVPLTTNNTYYDKCFYPKFGNHQIIHYRQKLKISAYELAPWYPLCYRMNRNKIEILF